MMTPLCLLCFLSVFLSVCSISLEEDIWFQATFLSFESALSLNQTGPLSLEEHVGKVKKPDAVLGNLLRTMDDNLDFQISMKFPNWMENSTHYRLFSGIFPEGMEYHFDGLAVVMSIKFENGQLRVKTKGVDTKAYDDYSKCIFFGTGTGPTLGKKICFQNPVVNLLSVGNQLWLTIDTHAWARIDPSSLETFPQATVDTSESRTFTLNAHPACDPITHNCYVQHPCNEEPADRISTQAEFPEVYTAAVCVSMLATVDEANGSSSLKTHQLSKTKMPNKKLIQHSHSPCITKNFIVAKLDAFEPKGPRDKGEAGLLKHLHQGTDNLWLVMDRRTNESSILKSNVKFVNNHFWNCYEEETAKATEGVHRSVGGPNIIVESVPATSDYLDAYFKSSFLKNGGGFNWTTLQAPQRCVIPTSAVLGGGINITSNDSESILPAIICTSFAATQQLVKPSATFSGLDRFSVGKQESSLLFDYPTFNPLVKMSPEYKFFYAISPKTSASVLYDRLIKVESQSQRVVGDWSEDGFYLSEATFLPAKMTAEGNKNAQQDQGSSSVDEEAGVLISLLYNANEDSSYIALFDPRSMQLIDRAKLPSVVPFNAHGLWCSPGRCYSNP